MGSQALRPVQFFAFDSFLTVCCCKGRPSTAAQTLVVKPCDVSEKVSSSVQTSMPRTAIVANAVVTHCTLPPVGHVQLQGGQMMSLILSLDFLVWGCLQRCQPRKCKVKIELWFAKKNWDRIQALVPCGRSLSTLTVTVWLRTSKSAGMTCSYNCF